MTLEEIGIGEAPSMDDENVEPMADFFDKRVDIYEKHMEGCVADFSGFYETISKPIPKTDESLIILDLGCGTGLELASIIKKAPNALLVCVDVSKQMLAKLKEKYSAYVANIVAVNKSYLAFPPEPSIYDYIVSVLTMHHQDCDIKLELYTKIWNALKDGACYIEGDYIVSEEGEREKLDENYDLRKSNPELLNGSFHIDIPCSRETQLMLFRTAGFSKVDVIWNKGDNLIFVAYK